MTKENKAILTNLALESLKAKYPSFPVHAIPVPKYSDKSTKDLTKCVIDFLNLSGHHAVEQKTTGKRIDKRKESIDVFGNKRMVGSVIWAKSTDEVGRADILAKIMVNIMDKIIPISVELEIKFEKDFQSNKQIEFQNKLESKGGLYYIIKTFDQFIEWYYNFINQYTMKPTQTTLSADVKLRIVATHKETQQQFTTYMTNAEWLSLEKNNKYNYLAYQI